MVVAVAPGSGWTFLSNHGHVLVQLARSPDTTMRDVAREVGITERAVQLIVRDLAAEGYIAVERVGRRNRYEVASAKRLRHPSEQDVTVGQLLDLLATDRS